MKNLLKQRLVLRNNQGLQFILSAQLVYLKGSGSYTDYHLLKNGKVQRIRQSGHLALHEARLDEHFLRISKSCIINLEMVEYIRNDRTVTLTVPTNDAMVISIAYWKTIRQFLA